MAIGTKVKVGFDGAAVKRGLMGLRRGFSGIGRMLGRGLKMGAMAGGLAAITGIGLAIKGALGIKRLADYGSELSDMAMQTGVAVSRLVELEEALRLAGVPAKDTSRVLSTLAGNIQEAQMETGMARDAFHDLGIYMDELRNMNVDQVFMRIGEQIAAGGDGVKHLERSMEGLFGARIGYGLLRLFKDPSNFDRAKQNVAALARDLESSANDLDRLADDLGGIPVQMRGFYLGLYRTAQSVLGPNPLEGLFSAFNYETMRPFFERVRNTLAQIQSQGFGSVMEDLFEWLKEKMRELGRILGEGIKEGWQSGGMKGVGGSLDMIIPDFLKIRKEGRSKGDDLQAVEKNTEETASLLRRIERQKGAVFA